MNGFAALDIHPHRRYVVDIGGRRSSRCRLHINFAPFLHSLDFTQNLGVTRSDMGKTNEKLASSCPGAKLLHGKVFNAYSSKADLSAWVETLSL